MEEELLEIRWNINFIKEEIDKINGSIEIKKEVLNNCKLLGEAVSECYQSGADKKKAKDIMKPAFIEFDKIIENIKEDEENKNIFMLLITHIADIKFLLLEKEEQEKMIENFKNDL